MPRPAAMEGVVPVGCEEKEEDTAVPGDHPRSPVVLDEAGLRDAPAVQLGGRRGDLEPGDVPPRARTRAVEDRVRRAVEAPEGRPLRRESEPRPAVPPVPGDPEAAPGRTSSISTSRASSTSGSTRPSTTSVSSRTTGRRRRSARRVWVGRCGSTEWRSPSSRISSRPVRSSWSPISAEITYGLLRICLFLQKVDSVMDIEWAPGVTLGRGEPPGGEGFLRVPLRGGEHAISTSGSSPISKRKRRGCSTRGSCSPRTTT